MRGGGVYRYMYMYSFTCQSECIKESKSYMYMYMYVSRCQYCTIIYMYIHVLYSQKYWWELNLMVGSQIPIIKI